MATHELRRQFATDVVTRLQRAGFQALWAGGCVRDLILGASRATSTWRPTLAPRR